MKLVSVIVPIYNKQKQLSKCILSLLNQTYENIEIILVDDGSKDNSLKICEKFKRKDARIKVISKINEGVDYARYDAIKISCGDYISFVDSDDFVPKNCIGLLVNALEKNNADISIGSYKRVLGGRIVINDTTKNDVYNYKNLNHNTIIQEYLESFCGWGKMPVMLWAKLYKKSLFDNIVPTGISYGEDLCMNLELMTKAEKVVTIPQCVYFYRWGGVTNFIKKRVYNDAIVQYELKVEYFKKYNRLDCIEMANVELCNYFLSYVDYCVDNLSDEEMREEVQNCLFEDILVSASSNVSFSWFDEEKRYFNIKSQDIENLINISKSNKNKRKCKNILMKFVRFFV